MLKVGLTGGIGAGKSEVSRRLASYGALVIDADEIAREVVEPGTPGLAQVVGLFGTGVLAPDGTLDRQRLGEIVFGDDELRAKLNSLIHPLVGARLRELEQGADADAILVEDVPLIAENDLADFYDLVVVVDVPPRLQEERLVRDRGMTPEQVAARIAAQASRAAAAGHRRHRGGQFRLAGRARPGGRGAVGRTVPPGQVQPGAARLTGRSVPLRPAAGGLAVILSYPGNTVGGWQC